jgi:hypothetical protein
LWYIGNIVTKFEIKKKIPKFKIVKGHKSINFSNFKKSALSDLDPSPEHSFALSNHSCTRSIFRNHVPTCFSCSRPAAILFVTYFRNFRFRLFSYINCTYGTVHNIENWLVCIIHTEEMFFWPNSETKPLWPWKLGQGHQN